MKNSISRRHLLLSSASLSLLPLTSCSASADKLSVASVERDAVARINQIKNMPFKAIQRPIDGLNHVLGAGQSLSSGFEAHPPLTTEARFEDVFSLGDAVQSSSPQEWTPHTLLSQEPATFQPLIARTLTEDTDILLSDQQAADLPFRDFSLGEAPIISAAYGFHTRHDNSNKRVRIIATESARGGSSLETISKFLDRRVGKAMELVANTAKQQGLETRLLFVSFVHGQTDEKRATAPSTYQDQMATYLNSIDDLAYRFYGQTQPSLKLITQPTSVAVIDDDLRPIAQVQLDLVRRRSDAVIVAPDFCVQNKTIHLTSNGSRMLGEYASKVADIVLNKNLGWVPTQLYRVWVDSTDDKVVYATFLVWQPPIQFKTYFHKLEPKMRADKGVFVQDDEGEVELTKSPEIVGDLTIKISLARRLKGTAQLALCSAKTDGANNICDSDDAESTLTYEFREGMDDSEFLPELVGKPFTLNNYALAESVPIPYYFDDQTLKDA